MRYIFVITTFIILSLSVSAQKTDQQVISSIFDNVLESEVSYHKLKLLCDSAPGRLLGTPESYKAMNIMTEYFKEIGADTIFKQEFSTPAWFCNKTEVQLIDGGKKIRLRADALGPSPSTNPEGITANVIEVQSIEELKQMDTNYVAGKIVFFNRAVDFKKINPFRGYSGAVDQRYHGPAAAAEMGASGVLVRSVGTRIDTFPHTGSTNYRKKLVPCAAISTVDADLLSGKIKINEDVQINLMVDAVSVNQITTYNLIADIHGSHFKDEYIVIAGHIDSWFNSAGAHDDGVGCVQSADVLRVFKELGIDNRRSIRAIMYMDEELYQSGGNAYAVYSKKNNVVNYLALEADAGGFTPTGFTVDANDTISNLIISYQKQLEPYGIKYIVKGGTGVDIGPLKSLDVPLMGYRTDPQRYMDLHHSAYDTFDKIHIRELQLGTGNMASIIYLIDKYGLNR